MICVRCQDEYHEKTGQWPLSLADCTCDDLLERLKSVPFVQAVEDEDGKTYEPQPCAACELPIQGCRCKNRKRNLH